MYFPDFDSSCSSAVFSISTVNCQMHTKPVREESFKNTILIFLPINLLKSLNSDNMSVLCMGFSLFEVMVLKLRVLACLLTCFFRWEYFRC